MTTHFPDRKMALQHGGATDHMLAVACDWWEVRVELEHTDAMVMWVPARDEADTLLPEDATWFIERSGGVGGPFERVVSGLPRSTRIVRDSDIPLESRSIRMLYYLVGYEYVDGDDVVHQRRFGMLSPWDRSEEAGLFGLSWGEEGKYPAHAPRIVQTIRERLVTLYSKRRSELVYLYRTRWDQPLASAVSNPRTGSVLYGDTFNSSGSFNTGRSLGFYAPVETLLATPTQPKARLQEALQCEMPFWPVPSPEDRVRTLSGHVYEIVEVIPFQQYGFPTHYEVSLTELPPTDALASLPLPAGHRMLSKFARRQFSRSMNLESYYAAQATGTNSKASIMPPTRDGRFDR